MIGLIGFLALVVVVVVVTLARLRHPVRALLQAVSGGALACSAAFLLAKIWLLSRTPRAPRGDSDWGEFGVGLLAFFVIPAACFVGGILASLCQAAWRENPQNADTNAKFVNDDVMGE